MIRILYLTDVIMSSRAGSEQHLCWLLKNVPEPEFERHFVVTSHLERAEASDFAVPPVVLSETCGAGKWNWWRRVRALARYIREHQIDLVQAFSPMGELNALLAVKLAGRGRIIGNRRDCGYHLNWKSRLIYRLMRWNRTIYIANSEAARQAAHQSDKTPLERITVIRNPVAFERFERGLAHPITRDALSIPPDVPVVGMVATVRVIKDHGTLLRAAVDVLRHHPATRFLMIGEDAFGHMAVQQRLAEELGIADHVLWYGGLDNPIRILPTFDVAVLSSFSESFSNAVLEYAVAGLPSVVSNVGGLGELVADGKTGFLVPPQDPAAMADRIVALLDNPAERRQFGDAARQFVLERYDEKRILNEYLDFYRKSVEFSKI